MPSFQNPLEPNSIGRVILMGAGPGDADYLTLKAVKALQSADVVLFDDLVSKEVLGFIRHDAKKMLVGKRARRVSCKQDDINAMMIKLARQGRVVVRLKSGDPMIFGRANEEIAELKANGIKVEVIAGITAASAFASSLGVSLTERGLARSVRYVTGHSLKGVLPDDLDWAGLADAATTLVVYMGGHTAGQLAYNLLCHGLSPQTPVIVASNVSRTDETRAFMRLSDLRNGPEVTDNPVLIGIGLVFEAVVSAALNTQQNMPLMAQG